MMDEYMLKSESSLKDLDFIKEIYTGITTSLIFTAVFVAITPVLGGKDIDLLLFGVVASFCLMEGFFIYFLKAKVPKDNIWYSFRSKLKRGLVTDGDRIIFTSVLVAIFGIILLAFVMIPSGFLQQIIWWTGPRSDEVEDIVAGVGRHSRAVQLSSAFGTDFYLPLVLGGPASGVLVARGARASKEALESVARLVAIAVEREKYIEESAHLAALREGDALKTSLLRAISHDLTTPLTSI
jgi:signal transduction histidine kinase